MNDLIRLILSLNSEEAAGFIAFAKAKNQRSDVKNIQLFKLLRSGAQQELDITIYGKPSKNALHALTNRLKQSLVDFIASKSLTSDTAEDLQLLKQLIAARQFLEQGHFSLGLKTLEKTIDKAQNLELYAILLECYHTKIQYAHLVPDIDLDKVIGSYRESQHLYGMETRLVMVYAILQRELASHPSSVFTLVKQRLLDFDISIDDTLSFKSLHQIMTIATDAASLTSNYAGVGIFMNHIFEIVDRKKHLADRHLFYHCEILYLLSGTYFRQMDYKKSQEVLVVLELELQKQNGRYVDQFEERIIIVKALNHNYCGDAHLGLKILNNIKKISPRLVLVKAMMLFQQEEMQQARRFINGLHQSDRFYEKKEGLIWVLQKSVLEILIYIQLNQPDMVESRMRSFKKRYTAKLELMEEYRVLAFMKLLRIYYDQPDKITEKEFKAKAEEAVIWKSTGREDLFVVSCYAFLKAKMEQTTIYAATLELANTTAEI